MPLRHRLGRELQLYCFFNLDARWGWMVSATPRPLCLWEGVPDTHCTGSWVGPGPVWTGVEKIKSLVDTEIRTPNRATHNDSLYRLLYPGPICK